MGNKFATLHSTFSVSGEVAGEDTRFLPIVIDLMHTKKNLNGSYFDKEVVNSCIDSIYNTPVLGFIKSDKITGENDFNGHEYIITRTANGIEESYIGKAFGVIPQTCNPRWVLKVCDDGFEREFLRVDALLWEKFSDAATIIKRDGEKPQSMELEFSSVDGYEDENGIFHFTQFRFDGACILGDRVEPAMIGANVRINDGFNFSMDSVSDAIRSELNDKLEKFNMAFAKFANGEICSDQGGAKDMLNTELNQVDEQVADIVDTESVDVETEFETETEVEVGAEEAEIKINDVESGVEAIVDEVEAEFDAVDAGAEEEGEVKPESEDEVEAEPEIEESFAQETVEPETDEADAESDDCNFSEMQAEIDSLKAELVGVKSDYEEILSSFNEIKAEYDSIKSEYEEIKPKYDEYVQAEAQRVAEELSAQKDAAFAEYESDLAENAEFSALKEKKDEMSLEDIEKECAFLYVKVNRSKNKFSTVESQSAIVGVLDDADESESDGFVLTKYGYIPVSR